MALERDPIINVVHRGIKHDIRVRLENRCYRGTILLVHAGMDAMAYLDMPAHQIEVRAENFIRWANNYIRFRGADQLTGEELYGARCAALHTYGTESRSSLSGAVRQIGYMDESAPPIRSAPTAPGLVLVSVPALVEAFFDGVDTFLIHLFRDKARAHVAEARFRKIMHELPVEDKPTG